jgi:hypothetical protein
LAWAYGPPKRPAQPEESSNESVITTRSAGRTRIRAMSESSLPAFGGMGFRLFLRTLRWPRLKGTLERLYVRRRDAGTVRAPDLEARAERILREHLGTQEESFERALRLGEKAERLEEDGTPSESARNKAERACEEVVTGLAALRASFVEATKQKGGRVFDRVLEQRCPAFAPHRVPAGRPR